MYFRALKSILIKIVSLWFFTASVAYAQDYVPLEALPGVSDTGTTMSEYLSAIFNIGIGVAAVFAVLMIVVGGVQYIGGASSPSARNEAKNRITNAILGLLLAVSSWLIVYIINPNLIKNTLNVSNISTLSAPSGVGSGVSAPDVSPVPTPIVYPDYLSRTRDTTTQTESEPGTVDSPEPYTSYSDYSEQYLQDIEQLDIQLPAFYTDTVDSSIDTTNDYNMVSDCASKDNPDVCTPADLDSSGTVDFSDISLLMNAYKYNINGDDIVDLSVSPPITYCFFKINTGALVDPNCIDREGSVDYDGDDVPDGIDDRYGVSCSSQEELNRIVFSFDSGCATDEYSLMTFSSDEMDDFKEVISDSVVAGTKRVDLRELYNNMFSCKDYDGVSIPCDVFTDNDTLKRITYSTIVKYDTNNDGFADFGGSDPLADFNGDGRVDDLDNKFIEFMNDSVFSSGGFVPYDFILGGVEVFLFEDDGLTDRQIIEFCVDKTAFMGCSSSDLDQSCVGTADYAKCTVTQEDLNKFDTEAPLFDVNGDGIVNFSAPGT